MRKHLAIFQADLAQKILEGQKTIESRFSKSKIPPFGVVSPGDLVYIKPTGKDIIGQFRVKKVISFSGMEVSDTEEIKEKYGKEIVADEKFWQSHTDAKYGTLIFIGEVDGLITAPITLKKKDLRGWVVLE